MQTEYRPFYRPLRRPSGSSKRTITKKADLRQAFIDHEGFQPDPYGNLKKQTPTGTYRIKFGPISLRYEVRHSDGSWGKLRGGYYKDLTINTETGKVEGLK